MSTIKPAPPGHLPFDATFRTTLRDLVLWRRDVRRFRRDPVPERLIDDLIELATHAPSVGFSQPWRFVKVRSAQRRQFVWESFAAANARALEGYDGAQRATYDSLKLAGLKEAPVHLAVFADESTAKGAGLGRQTMPETLRYSVVAAVQTLWLAARAEGLGVGWVSILDPETVTRALDVPEGWTLVAYLDMGWPAEEHLDPELERHHWEARQYAGDLVFER
ncbi:5,6-dimethylbenzimidazole synthase [Enhydrobacter sp.]|jgi:5,6-dimethylbenzimidazole synthase|uniref:5,6-dimethylbenzimidazole synthase n=1 Tax=Enhydrobacter sp. TaxID=1894999 RepID=UPI00260B8ACD|nr:5,6-dimethylbenzimidazole synthase [Enhydrobacter sp.]WIM10299.1 MAG: 5,6-dimethylbenzimidazole synthase [Enhydrobacter sp.]